MPLLTLSTCRARGGSLRALTVATGTTAYLLYNGVMFVFATPFNQAFLVYVAMLGVALWTLIAQSLALWGRTGELATDVPWWVPAYIWSVVVLNGIAWLARVLPATLADDPTAWLAGTGVSTSPVIVQDLAFWLPVMAWLGWGPGGPARRQSPWPWRAWCSGSWSPSAWRSTSGGATGPTLPRPGPRPVRS